MVKCMVNCLYKNKIGSMKDFEQIPNVCSFYAKIFLWKNLLIIR